MGPAPCRNPPDISQLPLAGPAVILCQQNAQLTRQFVACTLISATNVDLSARADLPLLIAF
jgi:hypothetical protein